MAIRVSKKSLVIIAVVVFAVLLGVGGYVAWRISQPEEVTPEEAAACQDSCSWCVPNNQGGHDECYGATGHGVEAGSTCACGGGSCCTGYDASGGDDPPPSDGQCTCDGFTTACGTVHCNTEQCTDYTCTETGWVDAGHCGPKCSGHPDCAAECGDDPPPISGCTRAEDCFSLNCEYPETTYCDAVSCGDGGNGECQCRAAGDQPCNGCESSDNIPGDGGNCPPPPCPVGYEDCGTSKNNWCGIKMPDLSCRSPCSDCNNPSVIYRYCRQSGDDDDDDDDDPICGDGILGNTDDEHCELGDPPGSECPWSSGPENERCDHITCTCPYIAPEHVQLQGRVYCQEEVSGELYPIEGAGITFAKITSGVLGRVELTTNSDGYFRSSSDETPLSYNSFFVKLEGVPADGRLSNDWPYSQMGDPVLENDSMCPGMCSTCSSYYDDCNSSNLTEGAITSGFRWVYRTCSEEPPNPDWDIEKSGSVVCYEEGTASVYAEVTYIITITNTQDGGILEYVRDEYEDQIQQSWILSTQPTASQITSEYIQWDIPVGEQMFEEGESREFRYTARIPRDLFGEELENHAIGHLGTDEELHAYEDIFVTCGLPITGIFDSTVARIALGGVLLVFGFVYYHFGVVDGPAMWLWQGLEKAGSWIQLETGADGPRKRWEIRMIKKINKRRRKSGKK